MIPNQEYGTVVPLVNGRGGRRDSAARPLRADARRNRAQILQAAQAAFAAEGLSVSIHEIARRAGVGVGTVYRHFPTKEALFEAIVVSALDRLVEEGRSLITADDPGAAFFEFLSRMLDEGSASKTLKDALAGAGVNVKAATSGAGNDLQRVTEALVTRAQRAGAVRDDLDGDDLMALLAGTFLAIDRRTDDAGASGRLVAVLHDGLRSRPG